MANLADTAPEPTEVSSFARRFLTSTLEYAIFVVAGACLVFGWMVFHQQRLSDGPFHLGTVIVACIYAVIVQAVDSSIMRRLKRGNTQSARAHEPQGSATTSY